jgi:hypothetical protein
VQIVSNTEVLNLSHCGGPYDLTRANLETGWHLSPTTLEEQAVIRFLKEDPTRVTEKRLLHVGIGNSSIFRVFGHQLSAFVGLTVNLPEKVRFEETFGYPAHAKIYFANKHDVRNFDGIVGPFDLIVDVNLKSYACCERHFQDMMAGYVNRLAPDGMTITAGTGLRFGWPGNTPIANTPGVAIDEAARNWRVLGEEGLEQLSERYHLKLERCFVHGVAHWHGQKDETGEPQIADETLWLLSKGSI